MTSREKVVAALTLLGGAYGAYRFLYLPWKLKQDLLLQAQILAAQKGISQQSALAMLGTAACQAIAAQNGLSPQASGPICKPLADLAESIVTKGGPEAGVVTSDALAWIKDTLKFW